MRCPNCLSEISRHFEINTGQPKTPKEGDIGLCYSCGQQMIMTETGVEPLLDKSFLSWYERLQLSLSHDQWSWKNGIKGS